MKRQLKLDGMPLIFILITIGFVAFNCEHKNALDNNKEITWQQTALDSLTISSLAASSNGVVFSGTCGDGIFRSTDHGVTWTYVNRYCCTSLKINDKGYVFAGIGAVILRSTNNGESWVSLRVSSGLYLGVFAFNKLGEIFVGSAASDESRGGIYRSVDNGDTWMQTGFPDSMTVIVLAINKNNDIFAGTGFGVFRSMDNGQTWSQMNAGFRALGSNPLVLDLAIDAIHGDLFAAISNDGVYRSTDNGTTWKHTGLYNPTIQSLVVNSFGHIFAASGGYSGIEAEGVFYSTDHGKNWSQINNGFRTKNVLILTVDSSGYIFAGTDQHGVFRTLNPTTR